MKWRLRSGWPLQSDYRNTRYRGLLEFSTGCKPFKTGLLILFLAYLSAPGSPGDSLVVTGSLHSVLCLHPCCAFPCVFWLLYNGPFRVLGLRWRDGVACGSLSIESFTVTLLSHWRRSLAWKSGSSEQRHDSLFFQAMRASFCLLGFFLS